jgi:radical SAM protein with 4Fe4S-binding SPASM domain
VALSPSATPKFLKADLKALRAAGLSRLSLSLDGATAKTHDAFRGVPGTWERTMHAVEATHEAGIEVQINTTITRDNIHEFEMFEKLLAKIQPVLWSVFQLVPTGRAKPDDLLNAGELEELFLRMNEMQQRVDYDIKTTEGMHYRRVAWQQWIKNKTLKKPSPIGINDGKGFIFVSHIGEVNPSGFLPLNAGNVREKELIDIYRDSPLLQELRNPGLLKGKCGWCEYRSLCGGSRARSYAVTGDYLESEPLCVYRPNKGSTQFPVESAQIPDPIPNARP